VDRSLARGVAAALAISVAALLAAACSGSGGKTGTAPTSTTTTAPTPETTATSGAATTAPLPNGYHRTPVFPQIDFDRMVGMYWIPGATDSVAVVTQGGIIYRASLADPSQPPSVYLDVRDRLIRNPGEEEGLLGLAFAPDFARSGRLYIYYSAGDPRRTVLARYHGDANAAQASSAQVLLEFAQPFANHNGGQLAFGPDGMLYIGLGDGGSGGDPMGNGQNTSVLLGKILRLDVSGDGYTAPADNPFATGGGRAEIWAYGFRNPWRFSFDRETGALWAGDVGQSMREEVDRVERGGDYGWNITEGDLCYKPMQGCDRSGLIPPRAVYPTHDAGGCAIVGGFVYRGQAMPELRGWYVYADYCNGRVWAVDTTSDPAPPVQLIDSGAPTSSFAQGPDGELYLVTFGNKIEKLERAR